MEKLFIPFLVSCVTGGKIVLISKVNFVLLRLKQKKQDMITSVKLMLNKSRILNNGSYPLVFQVIHNRRKKLLYTGYRMKEEVFDESEGKIMNGLGSTFTATEVVKMNRELRKMRNRIDTRIRQLERAGDVFFILLLFTAPATWICPPKSNSFSVNDVLPASGCAIIANVLRLSISLLLAIYQLVSNNHSSKFFMQTARLSSQWGISMPNVFFIFVLSSTE